MSTVAWPWGYTHFLDAQDCEFCKNTAHLKLWSQLIIKKSPKSYIIKPLPQLWVCSSLQLLRTYCECFSVWSLGHECLDSASFFSHPFFLRSSKQQIDMPRLKIMSDVDPQITSQPSYLSPKSIN